MGAEMKKSSCLLQLPWQSEASDGEGGVQPAFHAGAEEEAEGMSSVNAGFTRPADQKTQRVCLHIQRPV